MSEKTWTCSFCGDVSRSAEEHQNHTSQCAPYQAAMNAPADRIEAQADRIAKLEAALAEAREECAKLCDELADGQDEAGYRSAAWCAEEIRALKGQT